MEQELSRLIRVMNYVPATCAKNVIIVLNVCPDCGTETAAGDRYFFLGGGGGAEVKFLG